MNFKDLKLHPYLLEAIEERGYTEPSEIQKEAIPIVQSGRDLLASSQTGTGKTASFALPILNAILKKEALAEGGKPEVHALILAPTRELVIQIRDNFKFYSKNTDIKTLPVYGGVKMEPQIIKLKKGVDVIIATPGRLIDLILQKKINLSLLKTFVLDEADRMLDMGFIDDIKTVFSRVPNDKQTLLFSATYSPEIKYIAKTFMHNPAYVEVNPQNSTAENATHHAYLVQRPIKVALLEHLIKSEKWKQALVFVNSKIWAEKVTDQLRDAGVHVDSIHSDKSQHARSNTMRAFKEGKVNILIATDIAARGIDVQDMPYVVNFDLPKQGDDYVHRIGRTARAGESGEAITFISEDERIHLKKIERYIKQKIEIIALPKVKFQKGKKGDYQEGTRRPQPKAKTKPKNKHIPGKKQNQDKKKKASQQNQSRKENPLHKKK